MNHHNLFLKFIALIVFSMTVVEVTAQKSSNWHIGIELDVLPYATGGSFGALCVRKGKFRARMLTADVYKPDCSTKKGYTNHHITAYALVVDRFSQSDWKGWWIGGGPVFWKSHIQTDALEPETKFTNYLLNGSLGYHYYFWKRVYVAPWAGLSLVVGGDKEVVTGNKIYNLPLLNQEVSIKFGLRL
ncbi:MAG: hypothetical protein IPN29_06235 [Saprospiraceae bacterium]|nr:hypothetical protein [Saprospiraceae bacterium]